VREALTTLRGILERIISRPDDIQARRLRVTHPVLKVTCAQRPYYAECGNPYAVVYRRN
jgi:hypothetical protein